MDTWWPEVSRSLTHEKRKREEKKKKRCFLLPLKFSLQWFSSESGSRALGKGHMQKDQSTPDASWSAPRCRTPWLTCSQPQRPEGAQAGPGPPSRPIALWAIIHVVVLSYYTKVWYSGIVNWTITPSREAFTSTTIKMMCPRVYCNLDSVCSGPGEQCRRVSCLDPISSLFSLVCLFYRCPKCYMTDVPACFQLGVAMGPRAGQLVICRNLLVILPYLSSYLRERWKIPYGISQ